MKLTNKNLLLRWYTFNNLQICSADHTMTPDILVAMVFNDKRLNNMNKAFNLSIDIVLMFRGFYAWISTLWRIFFLKKCTSCTYIYAMWNSLVLKLSACAIYHLIWYSLFCLMCVAQCCTIKRYQSIWFDMETGRCDFGLFLLFLVISESLGPVLLGRYIVFFGPN